LKFLFVYENKLFMSFLKKLIDNNKDECIELSDSSNIYLIYRNHRPDWVLIDLQLKNNNGFKVAEILKSEFPEAKIALLSDFGDERLKVKSDEIGAVFIPKEQIINFYEIIKSDQKIVME
jgi:DNA-binding NarL/FixJ family response regulator